MNIEQARRTGYGEGVRAAAKLADDAGRPALAEEIRGLQSTTERAAIQPAAERYTCIGKGGDYTHVGVASGAGTLAGALYHVYRDTLSGLLFTRTPMDFDTRMQQVAAPISEGSASEAPQLTRSSFQTDSGYNVYVKELAQWWLKAATQQEAKADQADDQCHDCGKFVGHADWCSTSMYRNSDGTPIPAKPSSEASAGDVLPLDPEAVTAAVEAWRYAGSHPDSGNIDRWDIGCAIRAYIAADRAARTPAIAGSIGDDAEFRRLLEHVIQARHGGGWGEAFTAFTGFIDTIIQGARK